MTNLFAEHKQFISKFIPPQMKDKEVVLVDITNIASYTQMQNQDEFFCKDCVLNLPWDICWFEYQFPSQTMQDGKILKNRNPNKDVCGVLAIYDKHTNKNTYQVFATLGSEETFCLGEWTEPRGIRFFGGASINISKIDSYKILIGPFLKKQVLNGVLSEELAAEGVTSEINNVQYATTFCHCRNVDYYEQACPPKLQKARIKKGRIPQETYKILDIGELKTQAKTSAKETNESELSRALHICRGHFKTYTDENPLFGNITGTYWWPMHKRGDAKNGTAKKDYKI